MAFLPMNAKEMRDRGWNEVDFIYVCGDSYVDHPSFGAAIITRVLEDCGYKTAFLAQPNWKTMMILHSSVSQGSVLWCRQATLTVWLPTTRLQSVKDMMMPIRQAVKTAGVPTEPSQFTAT